MSREPVDSMSALHIPCPHCQKELKVKDPALLGRKVKCPRCQQRFVLQWTSEPKQPKREKATAAAAARPSPDPHPAAAPALANDPLAAIDLTPQEGIGRIRELQQRRKQRRNRNLIVAGVCSAVLAGGYFIARPYLPQPAAPESELATTGAPAALPKAPPASGLDSDWAADLDPTDGEPIELRMVPSGARLIANLRPAQLWSDDPQMAELRASLTQDVTGWLEAQLRSVCRHNPQQIEEVLLIWILGARGTEPELAAVVHLVEEARMSDLLDEFGSEAIDEFAQPKVYVKGDRATLILNTRTFATAPRTYGSELPDWIETPNFNTSDGIASLLPHTDRERLCTVVFEPADLQLHLGMLVGDAVRPVISEAAEWFAADAETVAWSLHAGEVFHSEMLIRGPRTTSALTLEASFKRRMERLPPTMLELVQKMQPRRSGFRQLIGRFPAMLEVFRLATISSIEDRAVRLLTVLPFKAAPNLALGTMLTWDESTRTDFSADAPRLAVAIPKLPETVLERLQLPVDAEFDRMPLQEALDYISGEIRVAVEIDGDALKDAGFTKNMAQTFTLGKVPAADALKQIIGQYKEPGKEMVVVIDEPRKTLVVMTRKFADQQGLTVHEFGG
jgi:predicted Zn finger-like uncharacterized protein